MRLISIQRVFGRLLDVVVETIFWWNDIEILRQFYYTNLKCEIYDQGFISYQPHYEISFLKTNRPRKQISSVLINHMIILEFSFLLYRSRIFISGFLVCLWSKSLKLFSFLDCSFEPRIVWTGRDLNPRPSGCEPNVHTKLNYQPGEKVYNHCNKFININ